MTFEEIGAEVGRLVQVKNQAYGASFARSGEIFRILYPKGISVEQMDDALAVARIVDKLFRIASDREAFGESPYRDIVGYGILGVHRVENGCRRREEKCVKCGEMVDEHETVTLNAEGWCRACFADFAEARAPS